MGATRQWRERRRGGDLGAGLTFLAANSQGRTNPPPPTLVLARGRHAHEMIYPRGFSAPEEFYVDAALGVLTRLADAHAPGLDALKVTAP